MYFKRLEIVGFKSFLNKTVLNFEPGITAIVGPNGCGKSNIFDAIRWVLGEQSVKALRGSHMEDVIFNGTDSKEPLSMAEVTVAFDNNSRFFSMDQPEVAITRRIFRSGESEYLLNKTQVRLKDITDLLSGTGIGAESYSLVEQGKIDLVLSSRPEDRRLVFDEASGITKYKAQKKEAIRKLEETEQNLLRVNDIITEVKRSIGSLERQANKARRYKEVFEEVKSKEINLAMLERKNLKEQKDAVEGEVRALEAEEARLLDAIKEQESRISNRKDELKKIEDGIMGIKNQILNFKNQVVRNHERISFNQERTAELEESKKYLETQMAQTRSRLALDEEKLNNLKTEYAGIEKGIAEKEGLLKVKEEELATLGLSTKSALENIALAKKNILELVTRITHSRNEVTDLSARKHTHVSRQKRLEIERAKVNEEKAVITENLNNLNLELEKLQKDFAGMQGRASQIKDESEKESQSLGQIHSQLEVLEKQKLALQSQKDFLEKLQHKYEDIGESMNAVIYLDRPPQEKTAGLVIKIREYLKPGQDEKVGLDSAKMKLSGEAKPIDLDTQKITEHIQRIEQEINTLIKGRTEKEKRLEELNRILQEAQQDLRNQEMALVNKKASHQGVLEQFNKIKEEEGIVDAELTHLQEELSLLEEKLNGLQDGLSHLEQEQKQLEDNIVTEQHTISQNTGLKEKSLVLITQTKTELESLNKRIHSDQVTLKILEDTYTQDKEGLLNLEKQMREAQGKQEAFAVEIKDLQKQATEAQENILKAETNLQAMEDKYREVSSGSEEVIKKIESDRKELDTLKDKLYQLQMRNKEVDFMGLSIKDRMLQAYKIDLDTLEPAAPETDLEALRQEIGKLKEKLDSLGSVNLVAIEEYDELKKRYDFLSQQQNDLVSAKDALHEAIQKINRTTKKMFLETFEKVRQEFRNYFRLLFNGGDAQIFLVDEQDPLESGIEIICRPPGKKLQNVLLLSGGEKSMSAIALIFAIFKIKPSPFCILDEIDAALDEANVDRFSRILQEFVKESQFIVITHNKKTIANADIMYGITMEESGVSKIVSVKFSQNKAPKDNEPAVAAA